MTSNQTPLDLDHLRSWIGRSETAHDFITPRLEASLRAVLDQTVGSPADGDPASTTVHWCLAPAIAQESALGSDGHPRRGGFLPPVPLPRRMWAGGELRFHDDFRVGDAVTRRSTIEDVTVKEGRSGTLCFVTVRHVFFTTRGTVLEERQDIVYREEAATGAASEAKDRPHPEATWRRHWVCDTVLLFRYSALTFNSHRIHYDRDYATMAEGYPALVVHGPLQATALLDLATKARGSVPKRFAFRGVSPMFVWRPYAVQATEDGENLRLWIADEAGRVTMSASAER